MIRLIAVLTLLVVTNAVLAQNTTEQHDYLWIQLDDQNYQYLVVSTEAEVRRVSYKDSKDKNKGASLGELTDKWFTIKAISRLHLIQEYEAEGWELFSIDLALAVMRKPRS